MLQEVEEIMLNILGVTHTLETQEVVFSQTLNQVEEIMWMMVMLIPHL